MARSFNGSSDRIGVDSAIVAPNWFADTYSLSVWVNGPSQTNMSIYGEGRSASNTQFWFISAAQSDGTKMRWSGFNTPGPVTTAVVFDSTWHHYVLAVGGASYSTYVDGVLDAGPTSITSIQTSMNHVGDRATIGSLGRTTYGNFFTGSIAELAIWTTKKLSPDDAKSLASGLSAARLGPTHYWPLWGADSPEPDIGLG